MLIKKGLKTFKNGTFNSALSEVVMRGVKSQRGKVGSLCFSWDVWRPWSTPYNIGYPSDRGMSYLTFQSLVQDLWLHSLHTFTKSRTELRVFTWNYNTSNIPFIENHNERLSLQVAIFDKQISWHTTHASSKYIYLSLLNFI